MALVAWLRVLFDWPDDTPSNVALCVLSLALVVAALVVVASSINASGTFLDHREFVEHDGGEQFGAVVEALGTLLLAVAVGIGASRGFSVIGRHQEPDLSGTQAP